LLFYGHTQVATKPHNFSEIRLRQWIGLTQNCAPIA
jgi:hypothetical protein